MQVVVAHSKSGMSARLRLLRESKDEPAPNSVHLVDEATDDTFCGEVDPILLTRLDKPWDQWPTAYRCPDCDALSQ